MKPSSSDLPAPARTFTPGLASAPSPDPSVTESVPLVAAAPSDGQVRAVAFDRQLRDPALGLGWSDRDLDAVVARAVDRGHAQGLAEGYAAGWAQGRRAAAEHARTEAAARAADDANRYRAEAARWEQVLGSLAAASRSLDESLVPAWDELADTVVDGVLALAAAALGRELEHLEEPVVEAVRTALRTVGDTEATVLRLNPTDHRVVQDVIAKTGLALPDGLQLVPDAEVAGGEVVALTPVQRLHLSLPRAVAAAEEVLRS